MSFRKLELLAPAGNADIAIQAILHGADAVYIGASSHGARKSASNSLDDIARAVDFAHQYRARVYATVNTILYDDETKVVERLCRDLYHIGVDALIIQDLGLLRMNLPPIALHASTQCDIRTPEKAKFLEEVGFSQLVLARELTLTEIKTITETVTIPVETFIHGALCVSYSGRCHASLALTGRSANRGECAQICRYPYTLVTNKGDIICKDKYLLSLKDLNSSHSLPSLIEAGVSSFKIEGRLKNLSYVKNITAFYHNRLEEIIEQNGHRFQRSSFGKVDLKFTPNPYKSFNRGFTDYFQSNRTPSHIASLQTPKSLGEPIKLLSELNNGDGISYFDKDGKFTGVNVNRVEANKITLARETRIPSHAPIYRTLDVQWEKLMESETASRKLALKIEISEKAVKGSDERGVTVTLPMTLDPEEAKREMNYKGVFEKLGNTSYYLSGYTSRLPDKSFYPLSQITRLRREIIHLLDKANKITYPFDYRKKENKEFPYISETVDYKDNCANRYSETFYRDHGVTKFEAAAEVTGKIKEEGKVLMTSRHCILRELGLCKKNGDKSLKKIDYPLFLKYAGGRFRLDFDCKKCEMKVCHDKI